MYIADSDDAKVRETADGLVSGCSTNRDKVERLFQFVQNQIRFGFNHTADQTRASQVLEDGVGYCNTKAGLFHALCKCAGVPSRVHFGLIKSEILRGIVPGFAMVMMPKTAAHSWIEVEVDGAWRRLDAYINDLRFYRAASTLLESQGWELGYSLSHFEGRHSSAFDLDNESFVHMGAVVDDHGVWDDPALYYASEKYPAPGRVVLGAMKMIVGPLNRKLDRIREQGEGEPG